MKTDGSGLSEDSESGGQKRLSVYCNKPKAPTKHDAKLFVEYKLSCVALEFQEASGSRSQSKADKNLILRKSV